MKRTLALFLASVLTAGVAYAAPLMITETASSAVVAMGKSLSNNGISFHQHTIREYTDDNGQPLHIVHDGDVLIRRPDRLAVKIDGDDGATSIDYDGKTVVFYRKDSNKYLSMPVTGDLEQMFKTVAERFDVDFPLADFLAAAPDQAFMAGVTSGHEVNTVKINGVECRHLLFTQPPGIEVELWTEKNERGLPLRVVVTYRSLPGEPRFIAELSNWKLDLKSSDADFVFTPPAGATQIKVEEKPQ